MAPATLVLGTLVTLLAFGLFALAGVALLLRGVDATVALYRRHLRRQARLAQARLERVGYVARSAARHAAATLPAAAPEEPAPSRG